MSLQSFDEFVDLVDQAIFEIDEILLCVVDEGDEDWEFRLGAGVAAVAGTEGVARAPRGADAHLCQRH